MEKKLTAILLKIECLLSQGFTNKDKNVLQLEEEFVETISEVINVRGFEDIENYVDGFSDEFHDLLNKTLPLR